MVSLLSLLKLVSVTLLHNPRISSPPTVGNKMLQRKTQHWERLRLLVSKKVGWLPQEAFASCENIGDV